MVKVKICGFTNPGDVENACEAGADMIGVVVDTPSPRNVPPTWARVILSKVPKNVDKVAVMVPRDVAHAVEIAKGLQPDCLQIRTSMPAPKLEEIKEATEVRLIIAVGVPKRVKSPDEIIARSHEVAKAADYILIDTEYAGARGGTGYTHDWNTSRAIREAIDKPLILAGGLNPYNVREAIQRVRPYGVDVSSGVEVSPGVKDPEKVRAFVRACKST